MRYFKSRYKTHVGAKAFWESHHWYDKGGQVEPAVELFDTGGILTPGLHVVENKTGKPETIRTYEQERALLSGGHQITINGIRHDSVPEFAEALNFALIRAGARGRYASL